MNYGVDGRNNGMIDPSQLDLRLPHHQDVMICRHGSLGLLPGVHEAGWSAYSIVGRVRMLG